MNQPAYRIKGFTTCNVQVLRPEPDIREIEFKSQAVHSSWVKQLHRALGSPRLAHTLYYFDGADKLASLWPTLSYFHPSRRYGPVKQAPVHLAQHLWIDPSDPDELVNEVRHLADHQAREEAALRQVLAAHACQGNPPISESALAMSVASFLFRGSPWLRTHREAILTVILKSPEAAYIALASGEMNQHVSILKEKIACSPSLTFQLWKSPILRRQVTEIWVEEILAQYPIYRVAAEGLNPERITTALEYLHQTAAENAFAAGICLGLHPRHDDAEIWWRLAREDAESLYWAGRVWQASGSSMAELPRYDQIIARVAGHPKWLYHWACHLEPDAGRHFAKQLWPSPWAAELIVDLQLPKDLLGELVREFDLNEDKLWESSLLLWGAEYATL